MSPTEIIDQFVPIFREHPAELVSLAAVIVAGLSVYAIYQVASKAMQRGGNE